MSSEAAREHPAPGARIPDFFIIGHHKSGTTALYEMLRRHPQIYMPDLKEPRWFATDLHPMFNPSSSSLLPKTFEEYLDLFEGARPDQRAGEATPSYLRSRTAAGEIAAIQPQARCIAILREPASFIRSLHLQLVQEHVEQEQDLEKALANEEIVRGGERVLRYSDHVHYVEQLRRFEAAFGAEQLLVLIYDDFRASNDETVRRVLRFLEVDDSGPIEVVDANPSVKVRSMRLDRAVTALYGRGAAARVVKGVASAVLPERARRAAMPALRRRVIYGRAAPPAEHLMADLRRRYKPEVVALSEYLDRDLVALWGYDRVE